MINYTFPDKERVKWEFKESFLLKQADSPAGFQELLRFWQAKRRALLERLPFFQNDRYV